ncbi:MAG: hypothetical protein QNK19_01415, partial [Xanthomonadales bacterium]|nr:hypothetical protein [Xanthomonadales bacterium]
MSEILKSKNPFQMANPLDRVFTAICLLLLLSPVGIAMAAQAEPEGQATDAETNQVSEYAEEMAEATEEVNTNDPTAAAISVSFGWEFFDWHEDEIAPGTTRPAGNDNNFNSRIVMPLAAGTLGSPWPIINRFSFANVKAAGGTSGSGNAEFISLFIPKTWATGKIGIGPALNLPADDKQFGANVWRYGLAGVALENSLEGRLMWGVLVRQVWGKTDPNRNKVLASPFALQPIVVYQLTDGWYLSNGESAIAYNWQKNEWLVPLGIRLGKTIKDKKGGTWNMYGEYRTNVVYKDWPGAAAKNIFRISASYT